MIRISDNMISKNVTFYEEIMKKFNRFTSIILAFACVICLSGCGMQQINLTEEESQAISEYAANVLLKYDKNYSGKLVDTMKNRELEARVAAMKKISAMGLDEEAVSSTDGSGSNKDGKSESSPSAPKGEQNMAKILGDEGFSVAYAGCDFKNSYQDTATEMTIDATAGKQLMVIKFNITNSQSEARVFDAMSIYPSFKIIVNGSETKNALSTFLSNDISTYSSTIEPGETREAVVLFEVAQDYEKTINDVSLVVKYSGNESVIPLN